MCKKIKLLKSLCLVNLFSIAFSIDVIARVDRPIQEALLEEDQEALLEEDRRALLEEDRQARQARRRARRARRVRRVRLAAERAEAAIQLAKDEALMALVKEQGSSIADIENLVIEGANPNRILGGLKYYTALHAAAEHRNDPEIIKLLAPYCMRMGNYNRIEPINSGSISPTHCAASAGNVEALRALINCGFSVNEPDLIGLRPLHYAASHGRVAVVEYLISCGARRFEMYDFDCIPLHMVNRDTNCDDIGVRDRLVQLLSQREDLLPAY